MLDELLALFYFATANNQHNNLKSLLNEKFADLLPVNVLVSSFTVFKVINIFVSEETSRNRYWPRFSHVQANHSKAAT